MSNVIDTSSFNKGTGGKRRRSRPKTQLWEMSKSCSHLDSPQPWRATEETKRSRSQHLKHRPKQRKELSMKRSQSQQKQSRTRPSDLSQLYAFGVTSKLDARTETSGNTNSEQEVHSPSCDFSSESEVFVSRSDRGVEPRGQILPTQSKTLAEGSPIQEVDLRGYGDENGTLSPSDSLQSLRKGMKANHLRSDFNSFNPGLLNLADIPDLNGFRVKALV